MGRYILLYSHPEVGERQFELLSGQVYRIGSRRDNEIVIPQKDVSRHHCLLEVGEGTLRITDLDSKNGTFINGKRVVSGSFRFGDQLNLSSARLVVIEEGDTSEVEERTGEAPRISEVREDTVKYASEAAVGDMVELLELTSESVRRGAVALPLSWAVERFGLEGALVLFCDSLGNVAMVSSAGNPGPLIGDSERLSRLVQEEISEPSAGPTLRQLDESGERLLVAPLRGNHVLVARCIGHPPAVNDTRALIASLEISLSSGRGASSGSNMRQRDGAGAPPARSMERILGISPAIEHCRRLCLDLAEKDGPVLVLGEKGTERERFARAIHELSARATYPFVIVSGRTGVVAGTNGEGRGAAPWWESVDLSGGGAILLEEVDELPTHAQDSLVAAMLDSTDQRQRLRVMATALSSLYDAVATGNFSQELYDLLSEAPVLVPPLRQRREDVPILADYHLRRCSRQLGKRVSGFTIDALELLAAHDWPGNERELHSKVAFAVSLTSSDLVDCEHLGFPLGMQHEGQGRPSLDMQRIGDMSMDDARQEFERWLVVRALDACNGNQTAAAERLGMSRTGLFKKLRRLGIRVS